MNNLFRIGWVGSPTTAKYLDVIVNPLCNLISRYPSCLQLVIVGLGPQTHLIPDIDRDSLEIIPWVEPDKVPQLVASFDIGIMPLHDSEWEKGKCGLKALEYMAAGIPALCSGVGENNFIINDGENGFIANTPEEWETKIDMLMRNPDLRSSIGLAGQQTISRCYSTKCCFDILLTQVLEPLALSKHNV